jgi:hypothetical protein
MADCTRSVMKLRARANPAEAWNRLAVSCRAVYRVQAKAAVA